LSSQYERIHFHHIDSSLSDSNQRINENQEQYNRKENSQFDLLTTEKIKHDQRDKLIEDIQTNENSFEKATKRLDGMYDKQFFWCCFKNIFFSYSSGNG
jgi:hypothetical protein